MSTPKQKTTKRATGNRRSKHGLKGIQIKTDKDGNPYLPHHATPATGAYKGKTAVDAAKRATRRMRRLKKIT